MVRTCIFCGAEELGDDLTYHGFPLRLQHGYKIRVWARISCLQRTPCYVLIILKKIVFKKALPKAAFSLEAFLPFLGSTNLSVSSVMLEKDRIKTDHFANFH